MRTPHKLLIASLCLALFGCEDSSSSSSATQATKSKMAQERQKRAARAQAAPPPPPAIERPTGRAKIQLTREDFAGQARDPFRSAVSGPTKPALSQLPLRRQREVRFSGYPFHELRLIAIVRSGRSIPPRALFVASDGVSKSIHQGEYFSENEILLASVNRDYVEIEIVDEELARGLNMEQGERRAIYLKQD